MRDCAKRWALRLFAALLVVIGSHGGAMSAEELQGQPTLSKETMASQSDESWIHAIPVAADPELEEQINELQEAVGTIHMQMVRRNDLLQKAQDAGTKTTLYEELEQLRKEREELETLLHKLVDEAKKSEQTAIDTALAKVKWLERQRERQQQQEENIRDRQQ